jgi:hypothetical protein
MGKGLEAKLDLAVAIAEFGEKMLKEAAKAAKEHNFKWAEMYLRLALLATSIGMRQGFPFFERREENGDEIETGD